MVKAMTQTAPDVEIGWSRRRHASRRRSDGVRHRTLSFSDWESDFRTLSCADSESDFRTPSFSDIGSPSFGLLDTAFVKITCHLVSGEPNNLWRRIEKSAPNISAVTDYSRTF